MSQALSDYIELVESILPQILSKMNHLPSDKSSQRVDLILDMLTFITLKAWWYIRVHQLT